jgi:DNA-binding response OmpR family regulator
LTAVDTKGNILLVDDDADVRTVIGRSLQRNGFRITALGDPMHALSEFKPRHFDMIILDVRMPGMTGFQLAKKIWLKDPDARIYFFSAFDIYEKEAKVIFKDLKSVFFIKKPISPNDLARQITETLQDGKKRT